MEEIMESITGSRRKTLRELGISIGRFKPGTFNAITDVKGIKIGHVSHILDEVTVPDTNEKSCVRSGVTAVLPTFGEFYQRRLVAGGFVLNGIGEVTGLTQVMEWGWLETPILLTNTMSIGAVYGGVIKYMIKKNPSLGKKSDVIIPIIGETNDAFLNDVRIPSVTAEDVPKVLENAKSGYVEQGSIGAGTGMTTCDFAGGIGTSSRVLREESGGFTIGVIVLSNFGYMRNLIMEGCVIGRYLEPMFRKEKIRRENYGSIIVVIATDAPLLPSQLSRIAKRAALGVGRTGSFASSSSGEIMIAFSTGNRIQREAYGKKRSPLMINFISEAHINPLYEAVIEATEEAVLNAIFCSAGIRGKDNHYSPPIPHETVLNIMHGKPGQKFELPAAKT